MMDEVFLQQIAVYITHVMSPHLLSREKKVDKLKMTWHRRIKAMTCMKYHNP